MTVSAVAPEDFHSLGVRAAEREDWPAALRMFRHALRRNAAEPRYHNSFALALYSLGRWREALVLLSRAVEAHPDHPDLLAHQAKIAADRGYLDYAIPALERALTVEQHCGPLLKRLAVALQRLGRVSESEARWREYLALEPLDADAISDLAGVLSSQGRFQEAHALYGKLERRTTPPSGAGSNLLLTLHYPDGVSPAKIFRAHRQWATRHEQPVPPASPRQRIRRKLRVGYVSGDFRRHSVACFFEPLLEHHDPAGIEAHCFSNTAISDATTTRLKRMAAWHDISSLDDDAAQDRIRRAGIDILVDLSGHTAWNRLPLFARKPAPVQVTYLGYPNTTGLRAMDYRLTDSLADPPGSESLYTEQLVRIDPIFVSYRPPVRRVAAGPPPLARNRCVTFGCFSIREKWSASVLEAWAEILLRVPKARLMLKAKVLVDREARCNIETHFRQRGIDSARLSLLGYSPSSKEHLSAYRQVDIMLDPFPYNGTTATCEALWAGVPVLTWRGQTHVSRVGTSILSQLDLSEFVAVSGSAYVAKAVELAGDASYLSLLRRQLQQRMSHSTLMDEARLARQVEDAYRMMWRS